MVLMCVPARAMEAPTSEPSVKIVINTSATPQCADFARRAAAAAEAYYPTIVRLIGSEGYNPPQQVTLTFRSGKMPFVAYTLGNHITCDPGYYEKHPNDVGSIVHEMTHVVQQYRRNRPPSWITEGMADWVRWFNYEPLSRRPHPAGKAARYNGSYRVSAAFLNWVTQTYDKQFVKELNIACRLGHYDPAIWKKHTGKSLTELGAQWQASTRSGH